MSSINNNNNIKSIKSPKLQGVIVEPILVYCINGISICELSFEIQRVIPLPYKALKKYLFYLISYELLSYDGQRQIYITEDGEIINLLDRIGEEKRMTMTDTEDIVNYPRISLFKIKEISIEIIMSNIFYRTQIYFPNSLKI